MNIPGYDDWKLRTPEDEYEASGGSLCPFCGAYSPNRCELEEETDGVCSWEESGERGEPDPDYLRDKRMDEDDGRTE